MLLFLEVGLLLLPEKLFFSKLRSTRDILFKLLFLDLCVETMQVETAIESSFVNVSKFVFEASSNFATGGMGLNVFSICFSEQGSNSSSLLFGLGDKFY